MDWIQALCLIFLTLDLAIVGCKHGQERPDTTYNIYLTVFSKLLALPIYGRVFGWW